MYFTFIKRGKFCNFCKKECILYKKTNPAREPRHSLSPDINWHEPAGKRKQPLISGNKPILYRLGCK